MAACGRTSERPFRDPDGAATARPKDGSSDRAQHGPEVSRAGAIERDVRLWDSVFGEGCVEVTLQRSAEIGFEGRGVHSDQGRHLHDVSTVRHAEEL